MGTPPLLDIGIVKKNCVVPHRIGFLEQFSETGLK